MADDDAFTKKEKPQHFSRLFGCTKQQQRCLFTTPTPKDSTSVDAVLFLVWPEQLLSSGSGR